jgi:hypothetical protein
MPKIHQDSGSNGGESVVKLAFFGKIFTGWSESTHAIVKWSNHILIIFSSYSHHIFHYSHHIFHHARPSYT